jgi:hypothetical protein
VLSSHRADVGWFVPRDDPLILLTDWNGATDVTFLWIVLATLYLTALVVLGLSTLRKGHTLLFWFGMHLPDPVDRWGVDGPDAADSRCGIGRSPRSARDRQRGRLPTSRARPPSTSPGASSAASTS